MRRKAVKEKGRAAVVRELTLYKLKMTKKTAKMEEKSSRSSVDSERARA